MASATSATDLPDPNTFRPQPATQIQATQRHNDAKENRDWVFLEVPKFLNPVKHPQAKQVRQGIIDTKKYSPDISNKQPKYSDSTLNVRLSKSDCLEAARKLLKDHPGWKVAVLNMANANVPGGGFLNGSNAQEESICARTTLFESLSKSLYPIKMPDLIYSPNVLVARGTVGRWIGPKLPRKEHYLVDVISAPAVNQPKIVKDKDGRDVYGEPDEQRDMEQGIRKLLEAAVDNNVNALVLGAWGCGVFRNPIREVARMIKEATLGKDGKLPPFVWPQYGLKEVVIAILDNNEAQGFPVWNGYVEEFRERPPLPDAFSNESTEEILRTLVWPSSKVDHTLKSLQSQLRIPKDIKVVKSSGWTVNGPATSSRNPPNPAGLPNAQNTQQPDAFTLTRTPVQMHNPQAVSQIFTVGSTPYPTAPPIIPHPQQQVQTPDQQVMGTIDQPIIIDTSRPSSATNIHESRPEMESLPDYVSFSSPDNS